MVDKANPSFLLENRLIGGGKSLIIGEIAQAHDGSLGQAHAFIDAVAGAGADAIKFQTHIAAEESTPAEPWRVQFSQQDASRYDYWRRMEFSPSQWEGLAQHVRERGMLFLSTPFSEAAVTLLERLDVPAWKIASGELLNAPLIDRLVQTGRPLLASTGMVGPAELDRVIAGFDRAKADYAVLQCHSAYPCPPERVGLNMLSVYRERYKCPVGLSDHSGTVFPGLAAVALGCDIIEVHVTLSRQMFGPDVPASVTIEEFSHLVDGVRFIERMRAAPVDKEECSKELEPMRQLFFKSLVAAEDLPAGTVLEARHLAAKKPGTGIPAAQIGSIVGRRLARSLTRDHRLSKSDLD